MHVGCWACLHLEVLYMQSTFQTFVAEGGSHILVVWSCTAIRADTGAAIDLLVARLDPSVVLYVWRGRPSGANLSIQLCHQISVYKHKTSKAQVQPC